MAALQPYSPAATCPKCLNESVAAAWHEKHRVEFPSLKECPGEGEHVCRRCERCGYEWAELPADADQGS